MATSRRFGRPATTASDKVGVYLSPEIRKRAAIAAIQREMTLSALVEEALRQFLAPKRRAQGELPLAEPAGGQVTQTDLPPHEGVGRVLDKQRRKRQQAPEPPPPSIAVQHPVEPEHPRAPEP